MNCIKTKINLNTKHKCDLNLFSTPTIQNYKWKTNFKKNNDPGTGDGCELQNCGWRTTVDWSKWTPTAKQSFDGFCWYWALIEDVLKAVHKHTHTHTHKTLNVSRIRYDGCQKSTYELHGAKCTWRRRPVVEQTRVANHKIAWSNDGVQQCEIGPNLNNRCKIDDFYTNHGYDRPKFERTHRLTDLEGNVTQT